MVKYENNKRVVARLITFIDDNILFMERHKKDGDKVLHYYTIPGGGVEDNESYEEAAIRETKEETTVDAEIVEYLEKEDYGTGICYWFYGKYISGTPTLGGEELERNSDDNHYKVVLVPYSELDNIFVYGNGKELIKKCYKKYKEKD